MDDEHPIFLTKTLALTPLRFALDRPITTRRRAAAAAAAAEPESCHATCARGGRECDEGWLEAANSCRAMRAAFPAVSQPHHHHRRRHRHSTPTKPPFPHPSLVRALSPKCGRRQW